VSHVSATALVHQARLRAAMSQTELGRRAGVAQSVVSAYEAGHREPSLPMLGGSRGLVPADGRAQAAAQPHPLRHQRAARRGRGACGGSDRGRRHPGQRPAGTCFLGPGRRRGQQGVRLHLAGPG